MIEVIYKVFIHEGKEVKVPIGLSLAKHTFYLERHNNEDFLNKSNINDLKVLAIRVGQMKELLERMKIKDEALIKDRKRLDPYDNSHKSN